MKVREMRRAALGIVLAVLIGGCGAAGLQGDPALPAAPVESKALPAETEALRATSCSWSSMIDGVESACSVNCGDEGAAATCGRQGCGCI